MASAPLKFRCDRCGQLLGVSVSRAGKSVTCPKCGAALTVPIPDNQTGGPPLSPVVEPRPAEAPWLSSAPSPSPAGTGGFFDAVDLEEEELRTLFPDDSGELPPPWGPPQEDPREEPSGAGAREPPSIGLPEPVDAGPAIVFEPDPPSIAAEPPRRRRRRPPAGEPTSASEPSEGPRGRSGRDVVIPRVALVAWSLFVLLALFLAFVAGLLVGHFFWTGPAG
ncbi:hypothetical protein [Tautonia sociabilis]|uniref:Uncharacterized protein n=1 Tax=Tautonia sociabilis TaxID=2080755 RepID=A0A432MKV9_9BACT|nr:hypothetical protein [Tautonia sociabilis]RUL87718.1 hypothetical protein TsocGM_11065 [Tautonia sociabilis]